MRPPAAPRQPRRTALPAPGAQHEDAPGGAVPDGAVPGGAVPDGAVPGGAVPGGAASGGVAPGRGALVTRDEPVAARRWLSARAGEDSSPARAGFLERLAEQTRARRRLAWRKVLVVLGVLVLLGAAAWVVLVSPLLALEVEDVTVSGAGEGTTVSRGEVMDVVAGHAGTPLARLSTAGLRADLAAITTVRDVQVTRSWPTGLTVDVAARVPVAATSADGGVVLLDVDGVVVGSADEPPEGLPHVMVPLSGERARQTLEAVLAVLAELPADLRAEVATAGASNPANIRLELTDDAEVRWGGVAESELKASVLEVLREREGSVYDLTVPRTPTISDGTTAPDAADEPDGATDPEPDGATDPGAADEPDGADSE